MKISPIDEKEYTMRNVWQKGVYPCTIVKCTEGNGKNSGDPYFLCETHIFNDNGGYRTVNYYCMAGGKAAWQLRSAVEAFGLLEKYQAGSVEAFDFEGKSAFAKVGIEEDETGTYEPKNIIREFTHKPPKAKETSVHKEMPVPENLGDSIPF